MGLSQYSKFNPDRKQMEAADLIELMRGRPAGRATSRDNPNVLDPDPVSIQEALAQLGDMGSTGVQGIKQLFERGMLGRALGNAPPLESEGGALAQIPDDTYGQYAGTQPGEEGVMRDQGALPYEGRGPQERGSMIPQGGLGNLIQPGGAGATLTGTPPPFPDAPLPPTPTDIPEPQDRGPLTDRWDAVNAGPLSQRPVAASQAPPPGQMPEASGGMSEDTKRAILSTMAGLSQAGKEVTNVQSLHAIMAGQPHGPAGRSAAADMLQKAGELSQARSDRKASALAEAENPLVTEYNKQHKTNLTSPQDVAAHQSGRAKEEGIKASEDRRQQVQLKEQLQTQAAEQTQIQEQERIRLLGEGDLSKLDSDQKEKIEVRRQKFLSRTAKLRENLQTAQNGIESLEGADINGMKFFATAVLVARAKGEVGNLSEMEQKLYKERPGLKGKSEAVMDWLTSEVSEGRIDAVRQILEQIYSNTTTRLMDASKGEVSSFRQMNKGIPEASVRNYMVAGMPIEISDPSAAEFDYIVMEAIGDSQPGDIKKMTEAYAQRPDVAPYVERRKK